MSLHASNGDNKIDGDRPPPPCLAFVLLAVFLHHAAIPLPLCMQLIELVVQGGVSYIWAVLGTAGGSCCCWLTALDLVQLGS